MYKRWLNPFMFFQEILRPNRYFQRIVGRKYTGLIIDSNYYVNTFIDCLAMTNYICLIVILRLAAYLLISYDIATPFLSNLQIMEPEFWEYAWVSMVVTFQFIGSLGLLFYNTALMKLYCFGIYVSISPLIWPFFKYYDQVKLLFTNITPPESSGLQDMFWQTTKFIPFISTPSTLQVHLWQGFPVGILVYEFLITTIAIHLSSGYYGLKLSELFAEYNYLTE